MYEAQLALTYFQNQQEFKNLSRLRSLISEHDLMKIFFQLDNEVRSGNITAIKVSEIR